MAGCSPPTNSSAKPTARPRPANCRPGAPSKPREPSPKCKAIAASQQVKEYLKTYGIVIVTNLREFLIVERGANGQPVEREAFALADDEKDFWQHKAAHPRATAQQKGEQFIEFIKRACLHAAPLTNPKDVAWFLASYARDALFRVEQQKQLPALQTVRSALEEALGMKFTDEKGEHFFRSTLVQTLFYGVFSAWVRWHKDNPGPKAKFDWRTAEWSLHVPFIRTLYEEVAKPSRLGPLGLVEVLDWAAGVLNRVDRGEFFRSFEDEHAVQYFYEPFLEAYDPELRKALGVWYTPPEIVKYQVARVDHGLARGTGPARRAGRPQRHRAGPLLRHGGVSGRSAAQHRGHAARQGRRCTGGIRPEDRRRWTAFSALRSCPRRLWFRTCNWVAAASQVARRCRRQKQSVPASI